MPVASVTYTVGVSRYGRFTIVFGYLVGFYDSKKSLLDGLPIPKHIGKS
jgi:hypothetical protein